MGHGWARPGGAGHGGARLGKVRCGPAWQGEDGITFKARQGTAWWGKAGWGKARPRGAWLGLARKRPTDKGGGNPLAFPFAERLT